MLKSRLKDGLVLVEHVACAKCRYDLFGIPIDGVCPECGHGVEPSRVWQRQRAAARKTKAARRPSARAVVTAGLLVIVSAMAIAYFLIGWKEGMVLAWVAQVVILLLGIVFRVWGASRAISLRGWSRGSSGQTLTEVGKPIITQDAANGRVRKSGR